MRKWILLVAVLLTGTVWAQQRTHHVEQGETLYSLSRKFNVTVESLIEANPFLQEGLKEGQDLVIPSSASHSLPTPAQAPTIDTNRFDVHVVEAGQTLYSLSNLWNLTIPQIQELNPNLENGLKVGQRLKLPKGTLKIEAAQDSVQTRPGMRKHYVMPGETVYSLARSVSWSEEQFMASNPIVKEEGLESGTYVWLPSEEARELATDFVNQEIKPKVLPDSIVSNRATLVADSILNSRPRFTVVKVEDGDSWRTLCRKYNTTKEELIAKNPELMNGISPGKYIIVPTNNTPSSSEVHTENLTAFAELGHREVHFALALPLYLKENDSLASAYLNGTARAEVFPRSKVALDFYAGLKLAMDTLRSFGLDVTVDVYDTENDPITVRQIATEIRSSDAQFVMGPLYSRNAEILANQLPDMWVVSPLSRTVNTEGKFHLVQAVSSKKAEHLELARWINAEARDANVIFVRRNIESEKIAVQEFLQHVEASEARTISHLTLGEDMFTPQTFRNILAAGRRDVFVILDEDPVLMASFVNGAASTRDTSISVVTTGSLLGMRTLEIEKLNRLDIHMADCEYINYAGAHTNAFLRRFRREMGTEPQRFAFHGYDAGMYFLPLFALRDGDAPMVWPGNSGIMKKHAIASHAGSGPYNEGVFMLHLENYVWTKE